MKNLFFSSLCLFFSSLSWSLAAQEQSAPQASSPWSPMLGLGLMFAVFYFLIILPQSRKQKKHSQFLASLEKGDSVITSSGLYGKIYGLTDKVVTLEIAPNVRIRVDRQSILSKENSPDNQKAA